MAEWGDRPGLSNCRRLDPASFPATGHLKSERCCFFAGRCPCCRCAGAHLGRRSGAVSRCAFLFFVMGPQPSAEQTDRLSIWSTLHCSPMLPSLPDRRSPLQCALDASAPAQTNRRVAGPGNRTSPTPSNIAMLRGECRGQSQGHMRKCDNSQRACKKAAEKAFWLHRVTNCRDFFAGACGLICIKHRR